MGKTITLKKYSNRRLYNTEESTYITLEKVAEIIREGTAIVVIDAQTKEDVTAFILTQIILEEARKKNTLLSVPVLHMMIQYGDNLLTDFFGKYLKTIMDNYLSYRHSFEGQFEKWLKFGIDLPGIKPFMSMFSQGETKKDSDPSS